MEQRFEYNKLSHITRKYWKLAYCDGIECAISNDGLLFKFLYTDVKDKLAEYPTKGTGTNQVWFFNETRDRKIAEIFNPYVNINPQFVWKHFKEILV